MRTRDTDGNNIRRLLLREMKTGAFAACDRLPRETVLSEQLGISRTQLRDTLAELEQEGFISRRQGVGTVINRHVLEVPNRMDIETEFLDIIRNHGYEPQVMAVGGVEDVADAVAAQKLRIPVGTPVLKIRRLYSADGRPALCCQDVIEKARIQGDYTQADLEGIIFDFLETYCHATCAMDLTRLHAVAARGEVARALQVPVGTPLLNMEEVDYDIEGVPVFCSSQFFVDELFQQTVLRKKL